MDQGIFILFLSIWESGIPSDSNILYLKVCLNINQLSTHQVRIERNKILEDARETRHRAERLEMDRDRLRSDC